MKTSNTLYIFDKDGTLTPPNSKIQVSDTSKFRDFFQTRIVVILTARNIDCCQRHIIRPIQEIDPKTNFENVYFGCSNGTEIYKFQEGSYEKVSIENNAKNLRESSNFDLESECIKILPIVQKTFPQATVEKRGEYFVAIACIPRGSNKKERNKCDPTRKKRQVIIDTIRDYFPKQFELIAGGQTSIDIAMINKEYGMRHIMKYFDVENPQDVHYFGDAFDGGNDEPVKNIEGIHIHEVSSPEDTFEYLTSRI